MLTSDNAFSTALALILGMDSALISIVTLSLQVSLMAVVIASLIALPLGAALALWRFPGRNVVIVALNALMAYRPSWQVFVSTCCFRAQAPWASGVCCLPPRPW